MPLGQSKDPRPGLRQFKQVLGTLDPAGMPLCSATVGGERADDPLYLPAWHQMVQTLGRSDFLAVGDCKMASLETRAQILSCGGYYLVPLPLTHIRPTTCAGGSVHLPLSPWTCTCPKPRLTRR